MLATLRENWKYKLLALICALALHAYVIGQSTAGQTRTLSLPLTLRNLPPNLLVDAKSLPQISVTLDGPVDDMSRLSGGTVTAFVELTHAHSGQNGPLPVRVVLPSGTDSTVSVDPQPSVVPLILQAKSRRRFAVSIVGLGAPPAGFALRSPTLTPPRATVEGAHSAVSAVQRLVVKIDENTNGVVDADFPVVALDGSNAAVEGLTITPQTVHVHSEAVRIPVTRVLLVSPRIVGQPAFPARVSAIEVSPPTLTVSGKQERLAQVGTLETAPIDVSGAAENIVRQVACVLPPGLSVKGSGIVTVTVRITAETAPTPATAEPPPPTEPDASPPPPQ